MAEINFPDPNFSNWIQIFQTESETFELDLKFSNRIRTFNQIWTFELYEFLSRIQLLEPVPNFSNCNWILKLDPNF